MDFKKVFYASGLIIMAVFSLLAVIWFYSEPTKDGDIYFHMAYGKQILQKRSLNIDESIYRWGEMPGFSLYPAWIPDIIFYSIYKRFGISGIYVFRYCVIFLLVFMTLIYMRKLKIPLDFISLFAILTFLVLGKSALMLKADLFTGVFFFLFVLLYFYIRETKNKKLVWLFPLISILWANSHISVIVGLGFLFLSLSVEFLFFRKDKLYLWILPGFILSAGVIFLNNKPAYYLGIFKNLVWHVLQLAAFSGKKFFFEKHLMAFQPITLDISNFYVLILLVATAVYLLLLIAYVKQNCGRCDKASVIKAVPWWHFVFILPFLRFFFLFSRMVFFISPVILFLVFWLRKRIDIAAAWSDLFRGVLYLTLTTFSMIALYHISVKRTDLTWMQDGKWVPLRAAYVIKHYVRPGIKVFNSYSAGSYFMLEFDGKNKVFIDSRAGAPFSKYMKCSTSFDLKKEIKDMDFDLVFIGYKDINFLRSFGDLKDYELLFWSDAGAMFIRKDKQSILKASADKIRSLSGFTSNMKNNIYRDNAFIFFIYIGRLDLAKQIYDISTQGIDNREDTAWSVILDAESSKCPAREYLSVIHRLLLFPTHIKATLLDLWRKREARLVEKGDFNMALAYEDLAARIESDAYIWRHMYNCGILHLLLSRNSTGNINRDAGLTYINAMLDYCGKDIAKCRDAIIKKANAIKDGKSDNLSVLLK